MDGEYFFGIQGNDEVGIVSSMGVGADKLNITEGVYNLDYDFNDSNSNGFYFISFYTGSNLTDNITSIPGSGMVSITKIDLNNQIISGKFEGSLLSPENEVIRITEGRFDSFFTR
ncbi:hypothetical protein [Nonlabens spongiae]|uniref:hypothetical protein n=1 Tax=Nonlabens spongiae TaxID=331648 RepID=UPI000A2712FB|nr:hypothetical protein [Nonlabens spongiae]